MGGGRAVGREVSSEKRKAQLHVVDIDSEVALAHPGEHVVQIPGWSGFTVNANYCFY